MGVTYKEVGRWEGGWWGWEGGWWGWDGGWWGWVGKLKAGPLHRQWCCVPSRQQECTQTTR